MKKNVSIMLVAAVMLLWSNALAKERRGATVVIAKKDGVEMRGELIAVKKDSLIVVDTNGQSETVEPAEIRQVEMKTKATRNIGKGVLLGLAAGAVVGALMADDPEVAPRWAGALYVGAIGAGAGGVAGLVAGAAKSRKIITIEGRSENELAQALAKLRKSARVPSLR